MEFKTVEKEVKPILEQYETTRADDMQLYFYYAKRNGVNLGKALLDRKYRLLSGIASYDTVSRVRRKLQAQYKDLRPSKEYLEVRKKAEAEYKKYAKEKGGAKHE